MHSTIHTQFGQLTITTDSSRGKCSPGLGPGWVVDFGSEARVKLGPKSSEGSSILEAESWSIRYRLQAARGAYPAATHGSTEIAVRSDGQLALQMLLESSFTSSSANRFCREEVDRTLHYTRHASIRFEWVKGHSGDPHNTAADRLAVLARRSREAELSCDEEQRLTAFAHQDILNDIRHSNIALAA